MATFFDKIIMVAISKYVCKVGVQHNSQSESLDGPLDLE